MIPNIDQRTGYLPPGVHKAQWAEIVQRFGGNQRRLRLLVGLDNALAEFARAGCRSILLNGSFIIDKPLPGDYDGAWEPDGVNEYLLDPVLLDWSNRRKAMKGKYKGELFPADAKAAPGITYRYFFQRNRKGKRKGIIKIDPRELL